MSYFSELGTVGAEDNLIFRGHSGVTNEAASYELEVGWNRDNCRPYV